MIDRLTNGDITKDELVYDQPYHYCLTRLAYWHEKDKSIAEVNRQLAARQTAKNR